MLYGPMRRILFTTTVIACFDKTSKATSSSMSVFTMSTLKLVYPGVDMYSIAVRILVSPMLFWIPIPKRKLVFERLTWSVIPDWVLYAFAWGFLMTLRAVPVSMHAPWNEDVLWLLCSRTISLQL